jgi:hypothetical protein
MDEMESRRRARQAVIWAALPVIVYALVAVIMTWPLITQLNSHIAGTSYGDSFMMLRQAWAARESVLNGQNPLRQDLLAYPNGFTSRLMWSTPLRWVPVMVLSFVVPPLVAFNVWIMVVVILNGWAAYALGMELSGRNVPAALLGGLVFTAFPNMQGHLAVGHIDVLSMYGLPLFALCAWRVLRREAGWLTVIAGGFWFALACLGLTSQIIYDVMPVVVFLGLYHVLWGREWLVRRDLLLIDQPWLKFGAMVALGGVILLIFFGPLMTRAGRAEIDTLHETGRVTYSADPLALVSPSLFGPLEKWGLVPDYARDVLGTNSTEGAAYLGIAALALVMIGVVTRRAARPWLLVAVGAFVLSLGPLLKWRDQPVKIHFESYETYVTLPWAAVQDLPVLDATRTPGRFDGALALAWGALVSIGAGAAFGSLEPRSPLDDFQRIFTRRAEGIESGWGRGELQYAPTEEWGIVQAGIALVIGIVILVEYQLFWPATTLDAKQPDYFRQLAKNGEVRAVLNVPVENPVAQMIAMVQQTVHGKPMIAGQLYRRSPQDPALLALLDRATTGVTPGWMPPLSDQDVRDLLARAGADRVIVNRRQLADPDGVVERLRVILGAPEYQDTSFEVYAVPRGESSAESGLMWAASADGWYTGVAPGAMLSASGEWYFYAPREMVGEVVFRTQPYQIARKVGAWLDDHLITAWWAEDGTMRLPLWVEAGFHTLRFEALDGCDPYPFTLTCLSGDCAPVETPECISVGFGSPEWIKTDTPLTLLDVPLDDGLRLRGYEVRIDEAARVVHVRLFWENVGPLPKGYALFVHVADPATGEPRAQYDGYPLIPVSEWDHARWVSDVTITLPDDLPGGEYAINVGWAIPETNTRLAVKRDRRWSEAGIVYLETIRITGETGITDRE